ncbi:MAG: plasmid pRiA4b ORF-3 family protein [Cyanobacteria bacterium P01_H01_bin.58]
MQARVLRWQVWLTDSDPPIWRRLQISSGCTLTQLHQVLQPVMGWQNHHAYRFDLRGDRYEPRTQKNATRALDAATVTLASLNLHVGDRVTYTYNLSDGWLHTLAIEKILNPDASLPTPLCLEGERACPPEDCGGIWGYEDFLDRLSDPEDPEFDDLLNRLGDFDPEAFDLKAVNRQLSLLAK